MKGQRWELAQKRVRLLDYKTERGKAGYKNI